MSKIALLGDIHGDFDALFDKAIEAESNGAGALIQVGDFGYYPDSPRSYMRLRESWNESHKYFKNPNFPIYYIDGNHDPCTYYKNYYRDVSDLQASMRVLENVQHLRRGSTVNILGYRVCALGGAASIDVAGIIEDRVRSGVSREQAEKDIDSNWWSKDENISPEEAGRAIAGGQCDLFVTHAPTLSMCHNNFPVTGKLLFGVGLDWEDPNMSLIETVWEAKGRPPHVCGHMHRNIRDEHSVILDIKQLMYFENGEFHR